MSVRVDLNVSLDGFATTTDGTLENPFGEDWPRLVDAYSATRTFRARVLGEDVAAWVVPVEGATVTEDELRAHCAERLSDYKVPRRWTFVDALPRNATGKVVKADLPGR